MSIAPSDKLRAFDPSISSARTVESTRRTASSSVRTSLTVRVVSDEKSWFAMRDEWNELLDDSVYPNIFLHWEWQTTWWESFGDGRILQILLVEDGGDLLGIAPLYRTTVGVPALTRCTRLQFIGFGGPLCPEYLGPIIRQGCIDEVCQALVDHLLTWPENWDELFLEDYALDDPGTTTLVNSLRASLRSITVPGEPRYYVSLPTSYNEYLATLSGHNRQKKRNRIRQASRKHDAQLIELSSTAIDYWFPCVTQLSVQARLRGGKTSPFLRDDYSSFHRQVLSRLMPNGLADVFLLTLDSQPVAFWYLLRYHDKYYAYQTGFDDSKRSSPGDVVSQMVLMSAIEDNVKEFDFLRGDHDYKRAYTNLLRGTQTVTFFRTRNKTFAIRWMMDRFIRPARARINSLLRRKIR